MGDEDRRRARGLNAANLREMITAADQYDGIGENAGLEGFLDHISLLTSADNRKNDTDELLLMTLHASGVWSSLSSSLRM